MKTIVNPFTGDLQKISSLHNSDMSDLQGGTTAEYFHFTSAQHTELTEWLDDVTLASDGDTILPNLTLTGNLALPSGGWAGLASDKGRLTLTDAAVDTAVFDDCQVTITRNVGNSENVFVVQDVAQDLMYVGLTGGGNTRVYIDSATTNAGFRLLEQGSAKWSIASYNGGRFTFYDDANSREALGMSSTGAYWNVPEADLNFNVGTLNKTYAFLVDGAKGNIGINVASATSFNANAESVLYIANGTAPNGDVANQFAIYSADRGGTALKASFHTRAEDGTGTVLGDLIGLLTIVPQFDVSIDGESARTLGMNRELTANTAGNDLTIQAGGAISGATDKDGGDLILRSGVSTGTGNGLTRIQVYERSLSTGSSDNTAYDRCIYGAAKALTDNVAISLFEVALPSNSTCGGHFRYHIHATDQTDYQSHTGIVTYSAINKATAISTALSHIAQAEATASSSGTLSDTFAITAGASKITITCNANSTLAGVDEIVIHYTLENHSDKVVTIL